MADIGHPLIAGAMAAPAAWGQEFITSNCPREISFLEELRGRGPAQRRRQLMTALFPWESGALGLSF